MQARGFLRTSFSLVRRYQTAAQISEFRTGETMTGKKGPRTAVLATDVLKEPKDQPWLGYEQPSVLGGVNPAGGGARGRRGTEIGAEEEVGRSIVGSDDVVGHAKG